MNGRTAVAKTAHASAYNVAYIRLISLVAAMGGLLFGYDFVVIGGAKPFYEAYFGLNTPVTVALAMSSALIGCLFGAVAAGVLSDRFGRKRLLILTAFMFVITSIATALAGSFAAFLSWRILGGVAIGLASNLSPVYIAEVSPGSIRGQLVSLNQLTIVIGILAAQVINWLIAQPVPAGATTADILHSWNGLTGWRWMFGVTAVPSALFFVSMFAVPESPRWLAKKGRPAAARSVLEKLGSAEVAQVELAAIEETVANEPTGVNYRELLDRRLMPVLALGVFLAVFQQWCGINVVFTYAEEVFAAAGYRVSDTLFNIVVTGITNLVFTVVAIYTVDRLGRRPLMLFGAGGMAASYLLLGASYHFGFRGWPVLALVLISIACYACSLAPVTWVILSEIFPNRIRGAAMAVGVLALWIACFLLTFTFPFLNSRIGSAGAFWLYAAICAAGFLIIRAKLPETKSKSLEQIEHELIG